MIHSTAGERKFPLGSARKTALHRLTRRIPLFNMTPYKERRQPGGSEQFGSVKAEETEAMKKTNAMRILEAAGIPYESVEYCWDEDHLDAISAAQKLHIDPDALFKTIVMIGEDNTVGVFCVPAPRSVSLKKIKNITGKKLVPLKLTELQKNTGYIRGGCSPIGMKKHFPTLIDETAQLYDHIYVSAGERGYMLRIAPADLQAICAAAFADIQEETAKN